MILYESVNMRILFTAILICFSGAVFILYILMKRYQYVYRKTINDRNALKEYYELCNQWLNNLHRGEYIDRYFFEKGYKNILIYGMGEIGKRLFEELESSDHIFNCFFVDKSAKYPYVEHAKLIKLEDIINNSNIDIIVITPIYALKSIQDSIKNQDLKVEIISIKDIIFYEY